MLDAELVANSTDNEIDGIGQGLRPGVKSGHGRQDDGAGFHATCHVLQLNHIQRRFSGHQDQPPPLLQVHIGRSVDQILR